MKEKIKEKISNLISSSISIIIIFTILLFAVNMIAVILSNQLSEAFIDKLSKYTNSKILTGVLISFFVLIIIRLIVNSHNIENVELENAKIKLSFSVFLTGFYVTPKLFSLYISSSVSNFEKNVSSSVDILIVLMGSIFLLYDSVSTFNNKIESMFTRGNISKQKYLRDKISKVNIFSLLKRYYTAYISITLVLIMSYILLWVMYNTEYDMSKYFTYPIFIFYLYTFVLSMIIVFTIEFFVTSKCVDVVIYNKGDKYLSTYFERLEELKKYEALIFMISLVGTAFFFNIDLDKFIIIRLIVTILFCMIIQYLILNGFFNEKFIEHNKVIDCKAINSK